MYRLQFIFYLALSILISAVQISGQNLKLHYDPSAEVPGGNTIEDRSGNGYNGTLYGGAAITDFNDTRVIDLGATNGYVDMGDAFLTNAKYADFRIFDRALSWEEVQLLSGIKSSSASAELLVEFDFGSLQDKSGSYHGTLNNGAELISYGDEQVLSLGSENGYFDFSSAFGSVISTLDSFSISSTLFIPDGTPIHEHGNFIWTFANSDNMATDANGNMFFSAISTRYAISKSAYWAESTVNAQQPFIRGRWVNLTYTQHNGQGNIFLDSILLASDPVDINPNELGATSNNYLGRSCYQGDVYLANTMYSNFRVYKGALDRLQIVALCQGLDPLNYAIDSVIVHRAEGTLEIAGADSIRSSIVLEGMLSEGVTVHWESSDTAVVTAEGIVYRPGENEQPVAVTLTATLSRNSYSTTKSIIVTVLPYLPDSLSVSLDLNSLKIGGNINNARSSLYLPHKTVEGSQVRWKSDSPDYMDPVGRVLKLSPHGAGKKKVILTATATRGEFSASRDFTVYIAEKENRSAYLFTYFTGNSQNGEQIRFGLSHDGLHFTPLNNGEPVINSSDIALKEAVRDPHILRAEDGETFYMVVTDMKSSEGWTSNRGIVLLKSTDLVNWTSYAIHFPTRWPEQWTNVLRVWALQTIYDPEVGKYMVYFSLLSSDGKTPYDQIFYCYANDDFTDLEGEPVYLFDRGSATIDGDIIFNEHDSLYHLFYKNEGTGGIGKVTAKSLTAREVEAAGSQWGTPSGNLEQTDKAVEGSGVFRRIDSDEWILMYDCYSAGHYQFCNSYDLDNFNFVMDNYDMDARHGTVMSITKDEADRLATAFPSTALSALTIGARNKNIKPEGITVDEVNREIIIPVHYGTDLTGFDPMFYATAGAAITPEGPRDFTKGEQEYLFTLNNQETRYGVKPEIRVNPVIPGFYADPEILYSEKTGRFYIYPTTDGYPGWGGYSFDVFSSPDLVNWTNEGTFLDLSGAQVPWAKGNAWAPCIEEKKINENDYLYYFYFSGESGGKKIGVAVADHPTGPFYAKSSPMIDQLPDGVSGQIIDGDVFTDPVSGKHYFYWGNGFMAVSELTNDMQQLVDGTTQIITPAGGTLSTYAYREGAYVFYRNGVYYFLWSVDDTGSPNYHVAYGTSSSPTGPINVAVDPIVIQQKTDSLIYGTGHNSVLQIPGRDEWYLVYHRINKDYLNNGPGIHREVCIDRLHFNVDGSIQQIVPSHRGIDTILFHTENNTSIGLKNSETVSPEGEIVKTIYYNLTGQVISKNDIAGHSGIYFIVDYYQNGWLRTKKRLLLGDQKY